MKQVIAGLTLALMLLMTTAALAGDTVMMATTTSTDNTGLLDYLAPIFQADTGVELKWTAVGTGKALAMGENCDVDVLMVHAPDSEIKFVDAGFGEDRRLVMYNDFVIVGPEADPAKVKGMTAANALKAIAAAKAGFASRGDNSGTNKKELSLWAGAGIATPIKVEWYVETGQGMIATLNVAGEKGIYSMTDRGTWIKFESTHPDSMPLVIISEGDEALFNQYSVMAVAPAHCPAVNNAMALKYMDWIVTPAAQKAIADFKLLGKPLFIPNAK
ncbi:MAG: substrate-binding domain-containing protein [Proteobacteria bacterium]|nr:substrate-binding domain-containing protein [Pseudomonadota bacterium]MBU1612244.1 substrate-binding domain-containing protein [Pseudomonadota bacterium]